MARTLPKSKLDYSLEIRYKLSSGEWSDWINQGKGSFQNIEIVQRQIRMLAASYYGRQKEIKFKWNGWLCDFSGQPTGEVISLK
jgi:hypothetical protein